MILRKDTVLDMVKIWEVITQPVFSTSILKRPLLRVTVYVGGQLISTKVVEVLDI